MWKILSLVLVFCIPKVGFSSPRGLSGISFSPMESTIPESFSVSWDQSYQKAYPNGDVYFLIGNLTDIWTEREFQRYYSIAKWLTKQGFRPIINPVAYISDVREAVQNPNTFAIIWSSHGNENGLIFDSRNDPLPKDIFMTDHGARFSQLVLSNCNGHPVLQHYSFPKKLQKIYWPSETATTQQLFNYLISDNWNNDLIEELGRPFWPAR